jgi:magnesium-transporting ATPase (P-type)
MSILVRDSSTGQHILWIKGADNVMLERSCDGTSKEALDKHLSMFASEGLRTLVLGKRLLTKEDAEQWLQSYSGAAESVDRRKEKLASVAEEIERDFNIIGITAIEDRLQDGVPETIRDLLRAGIKLWVLTGDKVETAINIGFSSKLLKPKTTLIRVDEGENFEKLKDQLRRLCKTFKALTEERSHGVFLRMMHRINHSLADIKQGLETGIERFFGRSTPSRRRNHSARDETGEGELALVVTGEALEFILSDSHMSHMLMDLGRICDSVVACRVSPSQKVDDY